MYGTFKKINMILYSPGAGGNFLTRLFALSDNTQFLWKTGTCDCKPKDHSIAEKLKYYWYFPEKISNWMRDAHLTPVGFELCYQHYDLWERNPIVITCMHYHIFQPYLPTVIGDSINDLKPGTSIKMFLVKSSNELHTRMVKNVRLSSMQDKDTDDLVAKNIKDNMDYDYIDVDLIVNEDTFLTEYHRVCSSMGLEPIDSDIALSFLNNWKQFRID